MSRQKLAREEDPARDNAVGSGLALCRPLWRPHRRCPQPGRPGVWPDAQAEVSRREAAAGLWSFFPCLCHAPVYMTPGPLSSEPTSERENLGQAVTVQVRFQRTFHSPSPSL